VPGRPWSTSGLPDIDSRIEQYAAGKQEHVIKLIDEGRFMAFPDALRFILDVESDGILVAAASSSKNAELFLERVRLDLFAAE
jgi:beta-phosphoglucomutase